VVGQAVSNWSPLLASSERPIAPAVIDEGYPASSLIDEEGEGDRSAEGAEIVVAEGQNRA
jgi:hypothetical protein